MHEAAPIQESTIQAWIKPGGLAAQLVGCLSPEEKAFLDLELGGDRSLQRYEDRLRRLGFAGHGRILDLACGIGQWTFALAQLNQEVVGIDKSISRLMMATALAQDHDVRNAHFHWSKMESLQFDAGSLDAVFCYGAFMFGRRDDVLREINRVLRSGGLLYVNANGAGWYFSRLSQALTGKLPARNIAGISWILASSAVRAQKNVAYSLRGLTARFECAGFEVEASGAEGSINGGEAFYPGRLMGFDGVFELLGRRK